MVADFAAAPVPSGKVSKVFCAAFFRRQGGNEKGDFRGFGGVGGACAFDDGETACARQAGLKRLEWVNAYAALVVTSVVCVGLFGEEKKGVVWLARVAAW